MLVTADGHDGCAAGVQLLMHTVRICETAIVEAWGRLMGLNANMLSRRILITILFILVVTTFGLGIRYAPNWQWIVDSEQRFREQFACRPLVFWCEGVLVYAVLSLVPGTAGKSVVAGWLFGMWPAVAMVEIGLTSAAVVSFFIGRYFAREFIQRRAGAVKRRKLARNFRREGAFYLLLLRFGHAPFTLVNYGAGVARIPVVTFWWTTHLGILPGTLVFTFIGTRIPSLQVVADKGVWSLLDLPLILALLATLSLPFVLRPALRKMSRRTRRIRKHLHRPTSRPDLAKNLQGPNHV